MKIIEIIVSASGETRLETKGFAGRDCLEASRQLEAALGAKQAEQLTGEYYAAAGQQTEDRLPTRGGEG
jgi:hypothetical protein